MEAVAKSVALDALIRRVILPYLMMGIFLFLFGLVDQAFTASGNQY